MSKKYDCVDAAKLVMSLFVVAIHANLFNQALFPTIRLAVPVFFIFTGFFTFSKINKMPFGNRKQVLWKIEKRYMQLYLFWFVVLLPFTLYNRQYHTYGLPELIPVFLRHLVWGSTFPASWYLAACMLGIGVVYLLSGCKCFWHIVIAAAAYLLATVTSKYELIIAENELFNMCYMTLKRCVGSPCNNVFAAILYIMVGRMLAEQKIFCVNGRKSLMGFVICYMGLLCEFFLAKRQPWFAPGCDCWFMLAPTAFFLVSVVMRLEIKLPCAAFLRTTSTIVYCSHLPVMMVVWKLISVAGIRDSQNVFVFSVTIMCSVILSVAITRLEKHRKFRFLQYSH